MNVYKEIVLKKLVFVMGLLSICSFTVQAGVMPDEYQCKNAYKVKVAVKANLNKGNAEQKKKVSGLNDLYTQVIKACLKAGVKPEAPEAGKDYSGLLFDSNITGVYFE